MVWLSIAALQSTLKLSGLRDYSFGSQICGSGIWIEHGGDGLSLLPDVWGLSREDFLVVTPTAVGWQGCSLGSTSNMASLLACLALGLGWLKVGLSWGTFAPAHLGHLFMWLDFHLVAWHLDSERKGPGRENSSHGLASEVMQHRFCYINGRSQRIWSPLFPPDLQRVCALCPLNSIGPCKALLIYVCIYLSIYLLFLSMPILLSP